MSVAKYPLIFLMLITNSVFAQSTYEQVRSILTTKCSPTCHGNNTYSFNISDPGTTLYDSLLTATPKNAFAIANNFKLISPGYPDRSYLLRKVANCISTDLALDSLEGAAMPENEAPLLKEEIELIRQWILFGAPDTGIVIDKALIDSYYQDGGMPLVEQPTPPKSCEGFQIHMGPIFYAPGEEAEYYQRYDLNLSDTMEIIGFYAVFNSESHHFIIEKYVNNTAQFWPQGLVEDTEDAVFGGDKEFLMAFLNGDTYNLPNGTAFFMDGSESFDLDFHLFNPTNEILAAEVYVNVYTQPKGNAIKEMESGLAHNYGIIIPNDSQAHTIEYHLPLHNKSISNLTSHTHQTGTNFDVYLRNSDGTKGLMIFNGSYNYRQGFETGSYDWSHPPIAFFDPFLDLSQPINNGSVPDGLIMEATYLNKGTDTLAFGITTKDEMMAIFIQYVDSSYSIPAAPPWIPQCTDTYVNPCKTDTVGLINIAHTNVLLSLYPNPSTGTATIKYELNDNAAIVRLEVVNILGQTIYLPIDNEPQVMGQHLYQFNSAEKGPGVYFVRLSVDGQTTTQKLIVAGN